MPLEFELYEALKGITEEQAEQLVQQFAELRMMQKADGELYKFEFGTFSDSEFERPDRKERLFIPVFSEMMSRKEMVKRLSLLVYGFKERMLSSWLHREDRPRTFLLGDRETGYGYRITEVK